MLGLSSIQPTVMRVAEAITAALDIETEIVDDTLKIIGGTGRYLSKIDTFEEDGDLDGPFLYADILRSGKEYVNMNVFYDDSYRQREGELAEIACPIKIENKIIGIIGLVAFHNDQKSKMDEKTSSLLIFLRRMADLIASKLIVSQSNFELTNIIESLVDSGASFDNIIGQSNAIEETKKRALQVAHSDSTILITGESGTGKELFARSIHSSSNRSEKPFIAINCGAIPEALLESELFGYEKGAFTGANSSGKIGKFELANRGTIFLDEIGDMPLHLQVKMLHVLQSRTLERVGGLNTIDIDVRIIAATNQNLEEKIEKGEFREDLYFRLNVIPITIPPLRERSDDIELLLNNSLSKFNRLLGKSVKGFSNGTMKLLKAYNWPGNVRELENIMEYAVNMSDKDDIDISALPPKLLNTEAGGILSSGAKTFKELTDEAHKKILRECLEKTGYTLKGKRQAAQILDISESTLYRRLRELGIKD